MTAPALRLAFPKGCRVKLTEQGRQVARHRQEDRLGTVTGYCRPHEYGEGVYVRWDGKKSPVVWHRDYLELV